MSKEKGAEETFQSIWDLDSEEQARRMSEPITKENCGEKLKLVREVTGKSRRELAEVFGVSESTIARLERKQTLPTNNFMLKVSGLVAIGFAKYSQLSDQEKEKISETVGTSGGVVAGVGGALGAISVGGSVSGLSAAGITSGLAALGGSMLGGLAVIATIPVAAGVLGYGLVKGIKSICRANNLECREVDGRYEIVPKQEEQQEKQGGGDDEQ